MSTQYLFDVPGPQATKRYRLMAVGTVLIVLALAAFVIYRFAVTGQFSARKWEMFTIPQVWASIFQYLLETLKAFALSAVLAMALGLLLAVGRVSAHKWIEIPTVWFVEIFRAVPVLILMMLMYYGLTSVGVKGITPFISVVVALTLYNGTILAEAIRSGIQAIPKGQSEAVYAIGMRKTSVRISILLPQALRSMLPVIIAQLVVVLKDTALGFIINSKELLYYAKFLGTRTEFDTPLIPATLVIGVIYVGLCMIVAALAKMAERRISSGQPPRGKRRTWRNTNLQIARVEHLRSIGVDDPRADA